MLRAGTPSGAAAALVGTGFLAVVFGDTGAGLLGFAVGGLAAAVVPAVRAGPVGVALPVVVPVAVTLVGATGAGNDRVAGPGSPDWTGTLCAGDGGVEITAIGWPSLSATPLPRPRCGATSRAASSTNTVAAA